MKKTHHVVLLRWKTDHAAGLWASLSALKEKLPGMLDLRWGANSSPEGLNQGFTHGLVMVFADAAARDQYLTHPDHEKVKADFLPFVDNVLVFDFEA